MAKKTTKNEVVVFPEKGFFTEQKLLKKHIKGLTNEQLAEWVEIEGLEFKPSDDMAINRMRMAMAINQYHFPKEVKAKKESPYKKYTNEQLIQLVSENNVPVEPTEDARILRMRNIMALRASKVIE